MRRVISPRPASDIAPAQRPVSLIPSVPSQKEKQSFTRHGCRRSGNISTVAFSASQQEGIENPMKLLSILIVFAISTSDAK